MEINQFRARVRHDHGVVNLTLWAIDEVAAKRTVLAAENCPERSILSIKMVKNRKRRR